MSGRRVLLAACLLTLPFVGQRVRGADEIEYFAYLPSVFFDRDLDFTNEYRYFVARDPQGLAGFKATFLDRRETLTGRPINFAPLGSALLWSPAYLVAHACVLAAHAAGWALVPDGLSRPYTAAACLASALWGWAGLLLLHDLLRRAGGLADRAATVAVLALAYGSPVLYYLTVAPAFSHACSLFAVTLLLWLWLTRSGDGLGRWAAVGAAGGLAALVREQDLLFLVAPGVELAWRAWRGAWGAALRRAAVMALATGLVFAPQLLAYRALNGRYGPSHLVRRKLFYWSPHFLEVLFDPGHGLFLWCPLLLLACLGLVYAVYRPPVPAEIPAAPVLGARGVTLAVGAALLGQVWINGAVDSWSQAGAFGARRFVGSTPLFAWGLAALAGAALVRGNWGRRLLGCGLALAVWWNVSLMLQFGLRLMDRQRLEWPRVAYNQVALVPRHLGRSVWLYLADKERLVEESR